MSVVWRKATLWCEHAIDHEHNMILGRKRPFLARAITCIAATLIALSRDPTEKKNMFVYFYSILNTH
jgi:hypothetical protein